MGDNFLEGQAKNTKKRRARATSAMQAPKLIERSDEIIDEFTVECREGVVLQPGDILRCFPSSNDSLVDVALDHRNIGTVGEAGGVQSLHPQVKVAGMAKVRVNKFDSLAGTAQVVCVEDKLNGQ